MEILLWLAPAVVVTLIAMMVVSWRGRVASAEVDDEVALERLGRALAKPPPRRSIPTRPAPPRSSGVAVRASRTPPTAP